VAGRTAGWTATASYLPREVLTAIAAPARTSSSRTTPKSAARWLTSSRVTSSPNSFDPTAIRAVGFDGYGTLFDYDIADFRREVAVILAEQGLETNFDEFFQTWIKSYAAGGVWGMEGPSRERPEDDRVMNGPLPEWHSQWEIWRRQFTRPSRRTSSAVTRMPPQTTSATR
jgi:hypothetical protein